MMEVISLGAYNRTIDGDGITPSSTVQLLTPENLEFSARGEGQSYEFDFTQIQSVRVAADGCVITIGSKELKLSPYLAAEFFSVLTALYGGIDDPARPLSRTPGKVTAKSQAPWEDKPITGKTAEEAVQQEAEAATRKPSANAK